MLISTQLIDGVISPVPLVSVASLLAVLGFVTAGRVKKVYSFGRLWNKKV